MARNAHVNRPITINFVMDWQTGGDSHCHLGIRCTFTDIIALAKKIDSLAPKNGFFHLMSTYHIDVQLLDLLLDNLQNKLLVVPYYGIHPWYAHLYTTKTYENTTELEIKADHYNNALTPQPTPEFLEVLPVPISIHSQLDAYSSLISKHAIPYGIGEIGLDKLARIPTNGYLGNKSIESTGLSPYRTTMLHQQKILQVQLDFASKLSKQVSVHCVKGHGTLFDIMASYKSLPTIILHSFSGSSEQAARWCKNFSQVMFSVSNCINGKKPESLDILLQLLSSDQVLVESDLPLDDYLLKDLDLYSTHMREIWLKLKEVTQVSPNDVNENILKSLNQKVIDGVK